MVVVVVSVGPTPCPYGLLWPCLALVLSLFVAGARKKAWEASLFPRAGGRASTRSLVRKCGGAVCLCCVVWTPGRMGVDFVHVPRGVNTRGSSPRFTQGGGRHFHRPFRRVVLTEFWSSSRMQSVRLFVVLDETVLPNRVEPCTAQGEVSACAPERGCACLCALGGHGWSFHTPFVRSAVEPPNPPPLNIVRGGFRRPQQQQQQQQQQPCFWNADGARLLLFQARAAVKRTAYFTNDSTNTLRACTGTAYVREPCTPSSHAAGSSRRDSATRPAGRYAVECSGPQSDKERDDKESNIPVHMHRTARGTFTLRPCGCVRCCGALWRRAPCGTRRERRAAGAEATHASGSRARQQVASREGAARWSGPCPAPTESSEADACALRRGRPKRVGPEKKKKRWMDQWIMDDGWPALVACDAVPSDASTRPSVWPAVLGSHRQCAVGLSSWPSALRLSAGLILLDGEAGDTWGSYDQNVHGERWDPMKERHRCHGSRGFGAAHWFYAMLRFNSISPRDDGVCAIL
ncbi:hypothetical protein HU200_019042 [Digitaria exilis]|uniref:Uncharacterized protein n=1 Tax=Digitaria exilis TaxID=1010633 RepID=A0A835KG64_9POAL|nr:hypothetical protein HU200_019042 [Digitaria exilis]